ncbi:MAG: hypothetical protein LLG45_13230 [Actinomycetia bacterium]|nr:hypothetical protein [Actinomycetes bacterium]
MEATEENCNTVADVASVKVEVRESDKMAETLQLVRALIAEGAQVQVTVHYAEDRPVEDVELVDIGKSDWRQSLRVPRSLSIEDRNKYIRERAVGAAQAFADALAAANGPCTEAKANKPAKGA